MKNSILILFTFFSLNSFSQFQTISQNVKHSNISSAPNGCVSVRLIVNYSINGVFSSSMSSSVNLNKNNTATLNTNIPLSRSLNIVSKQLLFTSSNFSHVYTIQNTNINGNTYLISNFCNGQPTNTIILDEYNTTNPFVEFFFTVVLGK